MRKFFSAILFSALALGASAAEKEVEGLKYFLPKTAIRMSVLVERTHSEPGQLADFSELYFKKPAPSSAQTTYRIVGVSFSAEGRPDTDKQFAVAIDKKHSVLSVDCDRNGVLRAINTKAPAAQQPAAFSSAPKSPALNPRDYMSQDILAAGNLPKMAQLVAQEIYDIRDSRNQLSRGEQLRLMYRQLATQEQALMQLFLGTTETDTTEHVITFVPERDKARSVVFRFSKHFGLVAADDYSGEPYYANIDDQGIIDALPSDADAAAKLKDDFRLGVSLPGHIRVTVASAEGKPVGYFDTDAAQFGRVEYLNGALFGKKFTSRLIVDGATGSVVSLKTEPLE